MKFGIEIRNIQTGAAHVLEDLQAVSNFLVGKVHAEWEGFRHLGKLPAPTLSPEAVPVAEGSAVVVDESAAPVSQQPAFEGGEGGIANGATPEQSEPVADAAPSSSEPS